MTRKRSWVKTRYIEAFFEESEDGDPPAFQVSLVGTDENIDKAIKAIEGSGYEIAQRDDSPPGVTEAR